MLLCRKFPRLIVFVHVNQFMLIMAALCNRASHYIFALWFLSSMVYLFSSPNLSGCRLDVYHTSTHAVALCEFRMQVRNVLRAARWKCRTQKSPKSRHLVLVFFLRLVSCTIVVV